MNANKPQQNKSPLLSSGRKGAWAPELRFSPTAWAKLVFLRDLGPTEVGAFAISSAEDLLLIQDIQMVRQECTPVTVRFDDAAVADYFDQQVDAGRRTEQFSRIWVHTHPDNSPLPSSTDERTFAGVFGEMQWAVMFILARGGQTYARLRFSVGPCGDIKIPVSIDYSWPFAGSDQEAWLREYQTSLQCEPLEPRLRRDCLIDERRALEDLLAGSRRLDGSNFDERMANAFFSDEEFFYER